MRFNRWVIAFGAVLVLVVVNVSIARKEWVIRNGEVILLVVQSVDTRALAQGDYMGLDFLVAGRITVALYPVPPALRPTEGEILYAPVTLDARRVASLAPPGTATPYKIRYRHVRGRAWLGTNTLFLEEGSAPRYAQARYGEFRLDVATGEAVLVGLRDADLNPLR